MPNNIQQTDSGERLSFFKLFKEKNYKIQIPIIQRDYAQGRETNKDIRNGFLMALKTYLTDGIPNRDLDFIYGSLINGEENKIPRFVPLDGQQRLTTLFLLHWYLANKEKEIDNFRTVFAEPFSENQWSSKFTYETRTSASEFCNALVSVNIDIESIGKTDKEISTLSGTIKNQQWYFLSWKNDPTIQGMLVMLDAIHELFLNDQESYYERLTNSENPIITFQFLKLEEFGLTDDLYIKMNARGKPLTSFENFKAKFEKQIKQPEFNVKEYVLGSNGKVRTVALHEYFSHKIDTDWANLFWAYAKEELEKAKELEKQNKKEQVISYDDIIMNLFKTFAINFVAGKPNTDKQVRDLIKTNSKELTYNQFNQYNCFDSGSVPSLIALLDSLQNQDKKARQFIPDFYYYDEGLFEEFLKNGFKTAVYSERILFHAYSQYLIHWKNTDVISDTENFKKWMRVIHNLTENTAPYNNEKEFTNSIKGIDEVIHKSNEIHDFLITNNNIAGFDKDQLYEEQIKASLIERKSSWEALIFEAEQHGYFKGQIGFILRLCGVYDFYNDNKNCKWDKIQDNIFKQNFTVFFNKAQAIFDDKGLKVELSGNGDFIWERALLAIGDFLIREGSNKSFLIGKDRDISWKRLLRGDKDDSHKKIIKKLFDALNERDIKGSLELIKSNYNGGGWRKAFIDTPLLFNYLGTKRYVRPDSPHGFVLFKGERMTGAHVELYSYSFFLQNHDSQSFMPFADCCYYYANGDDCNDTPCAFLDDWLHEDNNFAIDIRYRAYNQQFDIRFFERDDKIIQQNILDVLDENELKISEKYIGESYVLECNESEIENKLIALCNSLKTI